MKRFGMTLFGVTLMCVTLMCAMAADSFVRGYQFDGATGLKTGANLEDLVTKAVLTEASGLTNNAERVLDGITLGTVQGPIGTTNWVAEVKDGSITSAKITDGTIVAGDIADATITTNQMASAATGNIKWLTQAAGEIVRSNADGSFTGTVWTTYYATNLVPDSAIEILSEWRMGGADTVAGSISWQVRKDASSPSIRIQEMGFGATASPAAGTVSTDLSWSPLGPTNTFQYRAEITGAGGSVAVHQDHIVIRGYR